MMKRNDFIYLFVFFYNVISFIQTLATINTPKVQAPFGVSPLHSGSDYPGLQSELHEIYIN